MKRVALTAATAGALLAFASGASAQQIVDVDAKIASLIATAIEGQLRSQLGVSQDQAPHADLSYDAKSITNEIKGQATMTFDPDGPLKMTQAFVGCGFGCNDTDADTDPLELKYSQGDKLSQSSEWSIALKVSDEFEFGSNVDIEGLGGIEDKVKVGVSLSTEFMSGREESQSIVWSTSFSVNTPKFSSVQAAMVVDTVTFTSVSSNDGDNPAVSFTLDTELKGGVNVPNLAYKFTDSHGKTVKSGKTALGFQLEDAYPNAADRTVQAKGKFSGDQWGVSASFYTFNEQDRPAGSCPPPEGDPDCATSLPPNATLKGTTPVSLPSH